MILRPGLALLILTIALSTAPSRARADEPACDLPARITLADERLPRLAAKLAMGGELPIVTVGTAQSLPGGGSRLGKLSGAVLLTALKDGFPDAIFVLTAHIDPRLTAPQMVERHFPAIAMDKPALVLWQAGGADARDHLDERDFTDALERGIEIIQKASGDAMLLTPLSNPGGSSVVDVEPYAAHMARISDALDVPLFDRNDALRHWIDRGVVGVGREDAVARRKSADFLATCLAKGMARMIIGAVRGVR